MDCGWFKKSDMIFQIAKIQTEEVVLKEIDELQELLGQL